MTKRWLGSNSKWDYETQTFVPFFSPIFTSAKKQDAHELKTVHEPKSVGNDVHFLSVKFSDPDLSLTDVLCQLFRRGQSAKPTKSSGVAEQRVNRLVPDQIPWSAQGSVFFTFANARADLSELQMETALCRKLVREVRK